MHALIFLPVFLCIFFTSCSEPDYVPKPRAFPRIDFPVATQPTAFQTDFCPAFTFEQPDYVTIRKDQRVFDEGAPDDCWFDLYYPTLNGSIYFSYLPTDPDAVETLKRDAFRMTDWHTKKATYIDEIPLKRGNVEGLLFRVEGPAASPYQFYLTDTLGQHFVRGAVYVESSVRPDSLAPVYAFMRRDMERVLETFVWTE